MKLRREASSSPRTVEVGAEVVSEDSNITITTYGRHFLQGACSNEEPILVSVIWFWVKPCIMGQKIV